MSEKADLAARHEDLKRQHGLAMQDLDEFSRFLNAWQAIADDTPLDTIPMSEGLAGFEEYASQAVHDFLETDKARQDGLSAASLGGHDCAAATINLSGTIRQTNLYAHTNEKLVVGQTLADCGIVFTADEDIASLIAKQKQDPPASFHIVQAKNTRQDTYITLAVSKMQGAFEEEPLFLVLMISSPDTSIAIGFLANKFGLSPSEAEIAKSFLDGVPLREIAEKRGRSYTTIRNQFQKVLDKTGCVSQTALFRLSFSFVQLSQQAGMNATPALLSDARRMTLPRPGGRVVGMRLSGAETGRPLLNFTSLFGHGLTPDIDARLRERNILLISVLRPGFGQTSVVRKGQNLYDCLAGDVRAVLDSLEVDQCPALARASAARPFYNLLKLLPDRISSGLVVNGMIPRNYIVNKTVTSKWTTALMSASIVSYPVAKLILGTGSSLLKRSEGSSFLTKMYRTSPSDCAVLDDPDVVTSIRKGVEESAMQGLAASAEDIVDAFQNWTDDLNDIKVPLTLYHGQDDPNVPIAGVREFARDHQTRLKLVEETEGGGQLCYSHLDQVLDLALGI